MRTAFNLAHNKLTVVSTIIIACGAGVSGCQQESAHRMASAQHYEYTADFAKCIPANLDDTSMAEQEHDCARKFYEAKKEEMNTLFSEVSAIYEERAKDHPNAMAKTQLEKFMNSQEQFAKFVKKNSKWTNAAFVRDYPYHYYGTMTDYINLRVKHLKNLKKELASN